jgi:hypothetical protein
MNVEVNRLETFPPKEADGRSANPAALETPLLSTLRLSTEGWPGFFLLRRKRLHLNYSPSCGSGNSGTIIPAVTGRNRSLESLLAR